MRQVNRDMLALLRQHSDGSLIDRRPLMRRTALGSITGGPWFRQVRSAALTTYLVQLESIVAGTGPDPLG